MAEDKEFSKPGYDARLKYYTIVQQYMIEIGQASCQQDYFNWIRLLKGLLSVISGYIRGEDVKSLQKKLRNIEELFNIWKKNIRYYTNSSELISRVDFKLNQVTTDTYVAAKHMLLPIKGEDDTELAMDEFFKGSDV